MQIFVRNLAGRTLAFDVQPTDVIWGVKQLVEDREGIPCEEQRLTYALQPLEDEDSLAALDSATLHLSLSLDGGKKKRKKKVYTKAKKIKHKHKKIPLAVLKYYRVDEDGKVQRLKRECRTPECGAGTYMANHENRQYCGKCHTTFSFPVGKEGKEAQE